MPNNPKTIDPLTSSTDPRLTCVDQAKSFCQLESDWRRLAAQTYFPSPFQSWEWALLWWRTFLDGQLDCLRVLVFRDATDQVVGIAPFYLRHLVRLWGVPCSSHEWRLLGNTGIDYESLTEEPIFLARAGWEARVRDETLSYLLTHVRREWDYVHLGLQEGAGEGDLPSLPSIPFINVRSGKKIGSALRSLPADWPTFRGQLSRSMRDNMTYYPRLLKRHGHQTQIRFLSTPSAVEVGLSTMIGLHRKRAQSDRFQTQHVNHLPDRRHEVFLHDCLAHLATSGKAFLIELEVDGVPIASQAFLECRDMLLFYYSGFEPQWQQYSPLLLIAQAALEGALARGIRVVNFLPGAAPWKAR